VVIPLYNKQTEIRRSINSVLGQTLAPAEVIVVDDGSTDGGAELVEAIGDPRIRLVRQPNAGVSAARNRGIALARSELIAFLDADDEWMPDHLRAICRLRDSFPQCQVFGTSYVFRVNEPAGNRRAIFRGIPPEPWDGVFEDYFAVAAKSDPPLCSSSVAATRTALQAIGGFPVGIAQGEDLLTWARLAVRYRIGFSTKTSVVFWQPTFDDSAPTRRPEKADAVAEGLAALLDQIDRDGRQPLREYLGLWHKMRGTMYLRLGDVETARSEFRKAWRLSGFSWRLAAYSSVAFLPTRLSHRAGAAIGQLRRAYRAIVSKNKSPVDCRSMAS
jgi:glycosyltransferase involved in cell wall biosynthesis